MMYLTINVVYNCDVLDFFNNLNMALQGKNVTVFKMQKKVKAAI